jgi:multiple sugar transport system substrate-binding protein
MLLLFPLFISLFLWSGCSAKLQNQKTIKVAYWGSVEEIGIITDSMRRWQKKHPDIKVVLEHTQAGSYVSKILTRIAGGDAPDIVFSEVTVFVPMYYKNVFLDLTPFIAKDREFQINDYFPAIVKRFTRDNKIYCIPRDVAPIACVYFNKNLFNQAGIPYPADDWTLDDLLATAKKLTVNESGSKQIQYGFYSWCWQNFVYCFGGSIVDNIEHPVKCVLDSQDAVKGLKFYSDLANRYNVSPSPLVLNSMQRSSGDLFMAGKLAMYNSGIWETPRFRTIKDFNWDIAMFPRGPAGRRFETGGSGYCIVRTTKNPEAAWEVLKALAGDYGQEMLAASGLAQPANQKIAEGKFWALSPDKPLNKGMLNKAVSYSVYAPFNPFWQEAQDKYLNNALDNVFNGKMTPAELARKIVPQINEFLSKNAY